MSRTERIRAAAVQMEARIADVSGNIERAANLVEEAFGKGAEWVALPEFFTSPVVYDDALRNVAQPPDGPPTRMLRELARANHGYVGGSFLARDGEDTVNRFVLAGPDGEVLGMHDKDQPTMWENAYYVGGLDDGVLETPRGPVGAAVCWELIRTRTARRLRGRVRAVWTGSAWWDWPAWGGAAGDRIRARNHALIHRAPAALACRVGAPVLHGSHVGRFVCATPGLPRLPFDSRYLGETQIVSAGGTILARRTAREGAGVVVGEIALGPAPPVASLPKRFWIPRMPVWARVAWAYQNALGRRDYRRAQAQGRFPR